MANTELVNIAEMIDLAIGTPELGVVDFCMLQTVLHCLAQQQNILSKNVELRGIAPSLAATGKQLETKDTVKVEEFAVETEDGKEEPESILVVERVLKSTGAPKGPIKRKSVKEVVVESDEPVAEAEAEEREVTKEISKPSGVPELSSADKLCLVTISKFNVLEGIVDDLKNRVYGSMSNNQQILKEVRSQSNLNAISDMWQQLNVSSRLQAAEDGIAKLSSLFQDVVSQITAPQEGAAAGADGSTKPVILQPPSFDTSGVKEEIAHLSQTLGNLKSEHDNLVETFNSAMKLLGAKTELQPAVIAPPPIQSQPVMKPPVILTPTMELQPAVIAPPPIQSQPVMKPPVILTPTMELQPKVIAPPPLQSQPVMDPPVILTSTMDGESLEKINALQARLNILEQQLRNCNAVVCGLEGNLQVQTNALQDKIEHYAKPQAQSNQSGGNLSPEPVKELQGLVDLFSTVQSMQEQLNQVHEASLQLAAEKEERQVNIKVLLEQVELLKAIKLDREDMVEALADKADLRMLSRKVSHDQFEMACEDLSKGLEHALGKLTFQESLWQQALDDIQREIEAKLNKIDLPPVKDFFNNKLMHLQETLKHMIAMRREVEAAGTKKMLRDVNCISCDAKACMAMEPGDASPSKAAKPSKSMRPYLTYELDAIRKSQASNLPNRNMHDWEKIDKQMTASSPKLKKVRSETDKHICNRYCGGSHTKTTASQRVARLGHFINQWGPDVVPLSSSKYAKGDDGRLYKVTSIEAAPVGPGGAVDALLSKSGQSIAVKKVDSKHDIPKTPQDCRCLDERLKKK